MKKIVSMFLLLAFVFSDFFIFLGVFASANIVVDQFGIQVNNGTRMAGDIYAKPGDTLKILVGGEDKGNGSTNVGLEYVFSHTEFSYVNPQTIDSYRNWIKVNENISLGEFNPPVLNNLPMTPISEKGDILDAHPLELKLDKNTSKSLLTIGAHFTADGFYVGNTLTRNIFVDVRPHVVDYFFEKSDNQVTNQIQGSHAEPINFVLKVRDFNGCENIDGGMITANLSQLGAQTEEVLSFFSCEGDNNTAIFKKTGITTDVPLATYEFSPGMIQVIDEDGNSALLDDTETPFDDINKKTSVFLTVVPADAANVEVLNFVDTFIGGPEKISSSFEGRANQSGESKLVLGTDGVCQDGQILQDWTAGVEANTAFPLNIFATDLVEGENSFQLCVRNSGGNIGSYQIFITKDIVVPELTSPITSPANIILNNSSVSFICSESGEYQVRLGGTGVFDGTLLASGEVTENVRVSTQILNNDLVLGDNTLYLYCKDRATNSVFTTTNIKKVPPTPDMSAVLNFGDNDFDYQGLDGRDISIEWDNTAAVGYDDFESYRVYLLPENISLNPSVHQYVTLLTDKNVNTFVGTTSLIKDSTGNNFVSGAPYKACIAIMGTNGMLGNASCSSGSILTSDNVFNAKVTQAKFINNTTLELTTDTTLDTNLAIHSGALISYQIGGNTFSPSGISSVVGSKILFTIPALGNIAATGANLIVQTGAIRSSVGGFNNYFSNPSISILDGQSPTITGFSNTTPSVFSNYYSGTIQVSYTFAEQMQSAGVTRIIFERSGGNPSPNKFFPIINTTDLTSGTKNISLNLGEIGLVSGAFYNIKIEGKDLAGNYVLVSGGQLKFDTLAPNKVEINTQSNTSNPTPTLSWKASTDNSGNGSGVENYILSVWSGSVCSGTPLRTITTPSLNSPLDTLQNGQYSFAVQAKDRMGYVSEISNCDDFLIDTSIPTIQNLKITDNVLNSTLFSKLGNQITLSAQLTNTHSGKIVADISALSGNASHTGIVCSSPVSGVSCSYAGGELQYTFNLGFAGGVNDGVRNIKLNVSTPTDVTTTNAQTSITVDSTAPSIGTIISPTTLTYGGENLNIRYSGITDNNLSHLRFEYSSNSGSTWNLIQTGSNVGNLNWDISSLISGNNYIVRISAFDFSQNSTTITSPIFSLDKDAPVITPNIFLSPISGEFLSGSVLSQISWNNAGITDAGGLKTFPISLFYSTNNGQDWLPIVSNIANSGLYNWQVPALNVSNVKLKIEVLDNVGNMTQQETDFSFRIDSTKPILSLGVATPPNGAFVNTKGFEISGNIADQNLKNIAYSLRRTSDNFYWNGTSFSSGYLLNTLQDNLIGTTYNFTETIGSGAIQNLAFYELIISSQDKAGNTTFSSPRQFSGDNSGPNLNILTQSGSYFSTGITIEGTATDVLSGVSSVKISIEKDGTYWNGSEYVASQEFLSVDTINNYSNWEYQFIPPVGDVHGQQYNITLFAYDKSYKVNNFSQANIVIQKDSLSPNIESNVFTFDTTGFFIGGENLSITWNPSLITDIDSGLSNNPIRLDYFNGSTWIFIEQNLENTGTYNFILPEIDTSNTRVRITVRDLVGNTNFVNSESFIVDSTPPSFVSIDTMDLDTNGQIDAVLVEMSENIVDSSIVLADFMIDGIGIPTSFETGNTSNDRFFILHFANSGNTGTTPNISYTQGSLRDSAGKKAETITGISSRDRANPRISEVQAQDRDRNGKIDTFVLTVSESLVNETIVNGFTLHNGFLGMNLSGINIIGNSIELFVTESNNFNTSTQGLELSLNNSLYSDVSGNLLGNISQREIGDAAKPILVRSNTLDLNDDGKLDTLELQFSEEVSGVNFNDFSVTDLAVGASYAGTGTINQSLLRLNINASTNQFDTDSLPKVSYGGTSLEDLNGNVFDTFVDRISQDKIIPKIVNIFTKDKNANGKIDTIEVQYSENIGGNVSGLTATVAGYVVNNYSFQQDIVSIEVNEKAFSDTGIIPTIRLVSNSFLGDIAGNIIEVAGDSLVSSDGVGPILLGARYDEVNNKIFLNFSEDIDENDFTSANIILENAGGYSISEVNFSQKSITLVGANIDYTLSKISFQSGSVRDLFGNTQNQTIFTQITPPIIINEVMLSQNSINNYIELKNTSDETVDISGFEIAGVAIPNATTLSGGALYVIARGTSGESILNITPDLVDANLDISGNTLILTNGIIPIDRANLDVGFLDAILPAAMERKNPVGDGMLANSWYRSIVSSGFDVTTALGTPASQNVADNTSPELISVSPSNNQILANGDFVFELEFQDPAGGVGIDESSITFEIQKFSSGSWGSDILGGILQGAPILSQNQASYNLEGVSFGKYRGIFEVQDGAGNILREEIVFYVDQFQVNINASSFDIGILESQTLVLDDEELIISVSTLGAQYTINSSAQGMMLGGQSIQNFDTGYGWGADIDFGSGYDGNIQNIDNLELVESVVNLSGDGELQQHIYKFKYGARIFGNESSGLYETQNILGFEVMY